MATDQLMAPLPQLVLAGGFVLALEAIDPTTGANVAGVTVSEIAIYGPSASGDSVGDLLPGPFMFVPGPEA